MHSIMNWAWLLGSVMATSAALVVTLAHADPPSPASAGASSAIRASAPAAPWPARSGHPG